MLSFLYRKKGKLENTHVSVYHYKKRNTGPEDNEAGDQEGGENEMEGTQERITIF